MITFIRHLRDCTSGTALLETTIVFPLVLTLMVGVMEFGLAFQDYHTADKSMRSAARYLARVPEPVTCAGWGFANAVELAVYGTTDPDDDTPKLIPAWDESTYPVTLDRVPACGVTPTADEAVVLHLKAAIPIEVQLLTVLNGLIPGANFPSTITIQVAHEERHIGG